jgi:feruloyl esterase
MFLNNNLVALGCTISVFMLAACGGPERGGQAEGAATAAEGSTCNAESLGELPDVRLTSVTEEDAPVPHCKVAGVIGAETNFELLLPDAWNGKFVMGGGGGFVGSVMNTSLLFGSLQAGYATVGTDAGHQGHPLDASWALKATRSTRAGRSTTLSVSSALVTRPCTEPPSRRKR